MRGFRILGVMVVMVGEPPLKPYCLMCSRPSNVNYGSLEAEAKRHEVKDKKTSP